MATSLGISLKATLSGTLLAFLLIIIGFRPATSLIYQAHPKRDRLFYLASIAR